MLYEYDCSSCGLFEHLTPGFQTIDECPTCKKPVKRLISRSAFHLVGESWPSKVNFKNEVNHIEKVLGKEEDQFYNAGYRKFPKGHPRAGEQT